MPIGHRNATTRRSACDAVRTTSSSTVNQTFLNFVKVKEKQLTVHLRSVRVHPGGADLSCAPVELSCVASTRTAHMSIACRRRL